MDELHTKYDKLLECLRKAGSAAVAFSGGVDSAFLLAAAKAALGEKVAAVTALSPSFPEREMADAKEVCRQLDVKQLTFQSDELELEEYRSNPVERCYHCKRRLLGRLTEIAAANGFSMVCEGSNADDEGDYRPGMRAVKELGVRSPLRECGFTKAEIRALSKELGLPTYNKPSFACLASRVPYGEEITREKLTMAGSAEKLLCELGLTQMRVRIHGNIARIEALPDEFGIIMENREVIVQKFRQLGFAYVSLDLQGYRTGSLNETIKQGGK